MTGAPITSPYLVEVTGVAGAGKSTLVSILSRDPNQYVRADFIHTRNPRHLLSLIRSLPRLAPVLAAGLRSPPRPTWPDVKLLAYVTEWHRLLCDEPRYRQGIVLLDQGPVYALVRLKAKGLGVGKTEMFERWWHEMLRKWAERISAVVWLDAPDETLEARINRRGQAHALKGESSRTAEAFLTRYRALFREAFALLEVDGGPELHRFDTSLKSAEDIAEKLRTILSTSSSTS